MVESNHTPGPWIQGTTLLTPETRRWHKAQLEENELREIRTVFANFSASDLGKSREAIAIFQRPEDARLCAAAPDLYEAMANLENDAGQIPDHAWNLVQAALKKARGE